MIITVNDHKTIQSLLDQHLLRPEQVYLTSGKALELGNPVTDQTFVLMESEVSRGLCTYLQASGLFKELDLCCRLLRKVLSPDSEEEVFVEVLEEISRHVLRMAQYQFDLAYAYLSWHTSDDYPIMHHLISALTLGRVGTRSELFSQQELSSAICAALSMNISMLDLQSELRTQASPLTREQRERIRRHPEQSAGKLRLMGVEDERWLQIVATHHELPDGRGYPAQIRNRDKSSLLLGVCDSFNARMAQREYKENCTAEEAVKDLFAHGDALVVDLTAILLEEIGIYPAGSLLQLQGNQIACSLNRGSSATTPIALVFRNSGNKERDTLLVDTAQPEYRVKNALPRRDVSQLPSLLELLSRVA